MPSAALLAQHYPHVTAHSDAHAEGVGISCEPCWVCCSVAAPLTMAANKQYTSNTKLKCLQKLLLRQAACMQHGRPRGQLQEVIRQPQQWQQELGQHELLTKSPSPRPLHQRRCLCKCWQTSTWRSIYSR